MKNARVHKLRFYCLFHLVCSAGWVIKLARVTSCQPFFVLLGLWVGVERRATTGLNVPDDLRNGSQIETDWVVYSHNRSHTDQGFMGRENFSRGLESLPMNAFKNSNLVSLGFFFCTFV